MTLKIGESEGWLNTALLWLMREQIFFFILLFSAIKIFCDEHFFKINLFIIYWLHWVFIAAHGLSLVAASRGYSSLRCTGFSLWWLLLLWSTGSRRTGFSSCGSRAHSKGSVVVAHGLSCCVVHGIFLDQGSNPCSLHWQVDS